MHALSLVLAALAATAQVTSAAPLENAQAAVPAHFACVTDSDCEVRNVGNCCGYYPMCANSVAELPDPCPQTEDGGFFASICGWPEIDSCRCGALGGCVSVQESYVVHGAEYEVSEPVASPV